VTVLASGSSGNAALLESGGTRLLVDAGLSRRETCRRLAALGIAPEPLDGILISHEHTDHTSGLPALASRARCTVFLTEPTHQEIIRILPECAGKTVDRVEYIEPGEPFAIGDFEVSPFSIPHDAADPVGYAFRAEGVKIALVTDLGYLPQVVKFHLRSADCLILESNHDLEMLKVGPYPWSVKQRVMSRTGHLSNHIVAEFLSDPECFDARPRYLMLAHLSENNNTPDLARISAEEALGRRPAGAAFRGELMIASQRVPLGPLEL
jgi:phosphoribosyl 1,2-cyclic phosphodiesterase